MIYHVFKHNVRKDKYSLTAGSWFCYNEKGKWVADSLRLSEFRSVAKNDIVNRGIHPDRTTWEKIQMPQYKLLSDLVSTPNWSIYWFEAEENIKI